MTVIGTSNKINIIDYLLQFAHADAKVILFNNLPPFLFHKIKKGTMLDSLYFESNKIFIL
jgi:hypothetical protein